MLDFFNFQLPSGVNYQEFYGGGTIKDWVKPRGAAMACFLLIGAGAGGRNGTTSLGGVGGGSGAVTRWIGPAIFIPDVLSISIGAGGAANLGAGGDTLLLYRQKAATAYTLLTASGASGQTGGAASSNNYFGAAGIFLSTAGLTGAAPQTNAAGTNSFLQAGAGGANNATTSPGADSVPLYGYPSAAGGAGTSGTTPNAGAAGYFITEPVLVGCGGGGGSGNGTGTLGGNGGNGGIGCGGGGGGISGTTGGTGGKGGDGAAFVWAW